MWQAENCLCPGPPLTKPGPLSSLAAFISLNNRYAWLEDGILRYTYTIHHHFQRGHRQHGGKQSTDCNVNALCWNENEHNQSCSPKCWLPLVFFVGHHPRLLGRKWVKHVLGRKKKNSKGEIKGKHLQREISAGLWTGSEVVHTATPWREAWRWTLGSRGLRCTQKHTHAEVVTGSDHRGCSTRHLPVGAFLTYCSALWCGRHAACLPRVSARLERKLQWLISFLLFFFLPAFLFFSSLPSLPFLSSCLSP